MEMRLLYGENSEIVTEFQRIINRLERNENIEDVLEEFAKKSGVADIEYFAAVFRYAKRYGGDLIAIIRHTAETIREKNETYNEIQTIISGKKMEHECRSVFSAGVYETDSVGFYLPTIRKSGRCADDEYFSYGIYRSGLYCRKNCRN